MPGNVERFTRVRESLGLTRAGWCVLSCCRYGPYPEAFHLREAQAESEWDRLGPISEREAAAGLRECLEAGWLRRIDEPALRAIRADIESRGLIGPVYGWPQAGDVDFTPRGVECYLTLIDALREDDDPGQNAFYVDTPTGETVYCVTLEASRSVIDQHGRDPGVITSSEPVPIGPWCVSWWERFPSGYRIDIEGSPSHPGRPGG
jgi:hypothetical protein